MAPFGQNYKGGQAMVICLFCKNHADGQAGSWNCEKMGQIIEIKGEYNQIFCQKFSKELVQTVQNLYTFREEYRKLG